MTNDEIDAMAQRLRQARTGREIRQLRMEMSDEMAKRVIAHPLFSDVDRLAVKLCQAYRSVDSRGPGSYADSEILWDYTDEDEE